MYKQPFVTLAPILASGLSGLLISQMPLEIATAGGVYAPPPRTQRRQIVTAGGSRGCPNQTDIGLTLLVPNDHIATTVSEHPTLFISVDKIPEQPLRFTLARPDISEPLVEKRLSVKSPGIIRITLPSYTPPLEIDRDYYWTVMVICNEKRPSENAYARTPIRRIPMTAGLRREIGTANDDLTRAEIYARSGIWLDAISAGYQAYSQERNPNTSDYFWQLLEGAGLHQAGYLEEPHNHG